MLVQGALPPLTLTPSSVVDRGTHLRIELHLLEDLEYFYAVLEAHRPSY